MCLKRNYFNTFYALPITVTGIYALVYSDISNSYLSSINIYVVVNKNFMKKRKNDKKETEKVSK